MSSAAPELSKEYRATLQEYLSASNESALAQGYELARRAIAGGLGVLDIVALHHEVASDLGVAPPNGVEVSLEGPPSGEAVPKRVARAHELLLEVLAPFEMAHRGFRAANSELKRLNDALEQRAAELTSANETIEQLARERAKIIAGASRRLGASLDYEATLHAAVGLAIPVLADACVIEVNDPDSLHDVISAHAAGPVSSSVHRAGRHTHAASGAPTACIVDLPVGEADLTDRAIEALLPVFLHGRDAVRAMRDRGPAWSVALPLVARGSAIGRMALLGFGRRGAGEHLADIDIHVAEDLAHRIAAAIDNARLYRQACIAIRVREDFLCVASHELKTPLTALGLDLQRVQRRILGGLAIRPESIARTLKQVDRLDELIADLIDTMESEEGPPWEQALVPLAPIVRARVSATQRRTTSHRVVFAETGEPLVVRGDARRIEKLVAKLFENGVKYSPNGGTLRVSLSRRDAEALLTVADEGVGIPRDQQERVFERFFRATNAPISNYGGLGLSLSVCRDIVRRHGGRIWVESELGKGATFHVAFPLVPASAGANEGELLDGARARHDG